MTKSKPQVWWNRLPPNEKSAIKWLSLAYFVHVVVFVIAVFWKWDELFDEKSALWLGLYTAVAANLLFFLFVGAAGFYIALRRPERDNINSRVWYVFRHSVASRDLSSFLMDQVTTLAAINQDVRITYTVTRYLDAPNLQCYDACCSKTYRLLNLLHDVPYVDTKHHVDVFTDKNQLPDYDGKVGELLTVRTTKLGEEPVDHLGLGVKKILLNDDYHNVIKMEIDSSSTTKYENKFYVLWKPSEPFFHGALRYSDNVSITLRNDLESKKPLVYGLTKDDISTELRYDEEHELYTNRTMKPGERLSVFLKATEAPEVTS